MCEGGLRVGVGSRAHTFQQYSLITQEKTKSLIAVSTGGIVDRFSIVAGPANYGKLTTNSIVYIFIVK